MRLFLRLVVLMLIGTLLTFTSLFSQPGKADACGDGCDDTYQACWNACQQAEHPDTCGAGCTISHYNCHKSCDSLIQ